VATIDAHIGGGDDAFLFAGPNTAVVANSITGFETGAKSIVKLDQDGNATADMTIALAGIGLGLTSHDFIV
jgi:hypothetical protein